MPEPIDQAASLVQGQSPGLEAANTGDHPVLELRGVSKTFPGTVALDDVSLAVSSASIHGLVGMNGSGKSTLVKILAGYHEPDPGSELLLDRSELHHSNHSATTAGIRVVHQDLGLIENLSVSENLAVGKGYRPGRLGRIRWSAEHAKARELLARFGYKINPRSTVAELAMAERTGVAIARALGDLQSDVRVLVLDEPTASMPADDVQRLFDSLRQIAASGVAVVYISHRLEEIFQLADLVSVLRDGRLVGTFQTADLDHDGLIELMVGERLTEASTTETAAKVGSQRPLLELHQVSGTVLSDIDLLVQAGEVVGVAGITGSGREELAGVVYGTAARRGRVRVDGEELSPGRPDRAIGLGMAYIPADRRAHATFVGLTVRENVTVSGLGGHVRGGWLRRSSEVNEVRQWIRRLSVRCNSPEATMEQLSGGNQQKVVFIRWLRKSPRVYVLDEPTQGVDVSAKADLHQAMLAAARAGSAVLICSSDAEELERICDRVVVLVGGRVAGIISGDRLSADELDRLSLASAALTAKTGG